MNFVSYGIIIVLLSLLSQTAFGSQQFDTNYSLTGGYANGATKINCNGTTLIVTNLLNKTTFMVGETITVIPELTNIGNKTVRVNYSPPLFDLIFPVQLGVKVLPPYAKEARMLFDNELTLKPNMSSPDYGFPEIERKVFTLYAPGNYTMVSIATFSNDSAGSNMTELWSKPLQITILPEKIPEFGSLLGMMIVISILSAVVISRRSKFHFS